jgi:hypothetical protein
MVTPELVIAKSDGMEEMMKALGQRFARLGIVLGIAVVVVLAGLEMFAQRPGAGGRTNGLAKPVARLDAETLERQLHDGYVAALASRRWEPMIAHGDAVLEVAVAGHGAPAHPWVDRARHSYLLALFRARAASSVDGMTRVADAFLSIGDRDAARLALRMARDAAPDARTAGLLNDRAERIERPQVADAN